jgi:foldase protein PrsA
MRKKSLLGVLALSVMLLTGCNGNIGDMGNKVIIKVNGHPIYKSAYEKSFNKTIKMVAAGPSKFDIKDPKNKFISIIYKDKVINDLMIEELLNEEAAKQNVKVSADETKTAISEIEKKLGGPESLDKMLKANNVTKETFEEDVAHQKLIEKTVVASNMVKSVTDEQVKKYYEENRDKFFKYPELVRASHILLANDKVKAQKILDELNQNPSKFADFAKKYSIDKQSAIKGGDLGFFKSTDMVPEFSKAVMTLTPGKISELVKSQFGYHIIMVVDKKKSGIVPFDSVKASIKDYLTSSQNMEVFKKIITNAKAKAKVEYVDAEYDPANLKKEIIKMTPPSQLNQMGMPAPTK